MALCVSEARRGRLRKEIEYFSVSATEMSGVTASMRLENNSEDNWKSFCRDSSTAGQIPVRGQPGEVTRAR